MTPTITWLKKAVVDEVRVYVMRFHRPVDFDPHIECSILLACFLLVELKTGSQ